MDLHGNWTLKSELWTCESTLLSPSHFCYPIECTNTVTCCKTHLERRPSLYEAWKKMTVATNEK